MIFATYWFFAFALVFFPVFWLLRDARLRIGLLVIASATFHTHFAGAAGVVPIIIVGTLVYLLGLLQSRIAFGVGIVAAVLMLASYKYSPFLAEGVLGLANADMGHRAAVWLRATLPPSPPLAISFFAFEFIHYLVDRTKGNKAIRNPVDFFLFSVFFPTVVAGPIKRYEQFLPSLREGAAKVSAEDVMAGLIQVAFGFLKKMVADNLTLWIESVQGNFTTMPMGSRWLVFAGIGIRILMDFSGYSDIAIGLARMMGVRIPANFNWPYLSTNIREFWHRWHISLSTWIRDYVYIPLGGNRHGNVRRVLNGLIAFSLCGLWHGPAWNFVLWGLYHGIGLSVSNGYRRLPGVGSRLEGLFARVPELAWLVTLLFVWFGWLLFFYPVPRALEMARALF